MHKGKEASMIKLVYLSGRSGVGSQGAKAGVGTFKYICMAKHANGKEGIQV